VTRGIANILKEAESGGALDELSRKHGFSKVHSISGRAKAHKFKLVCVGFGRWQESSKSYIHEIGTLKLIMHIITMLQWYTYIVSTGGCMLRKIFKTGNSTVVSIPREMLESLGMADGSEVSVELDANTRQIIIRPSERTLAGVDEVFARQVADFIDEYRLALEALAR
jgi:antitoxin MazE